MTRRYLQPEGRRFLTGGNKRAANPPGSPPPAGSAPLSKIKTGMEIIYSSYNTSDNMDFDSITTVSVKKGYRADKWIDAVRAKITARGGDQAEIEETATTVRFNGESALDICASGFDVIWLAGFIPPKEHLAAIRAKASKPVEIIFGFFNFESIGMYEQENQIWHPMDNFLFNNHILQAVGTNSYGCQIIDKFETDAGATACPPARPQTFGKHSIDVRIDTPGVANGWADLVLSPLSEEAWIRHYSTGSTIHVDGVVVDNILSSPFKGVATNDYPLDWGTDEYLGAAGADGQKGMLARLHALAVAPVKIWGNAGDSLVPYSQVDLQHRFVEHWYRKYVGPGFVKRTLGELQNSIEEMRAADIRMLVGGLDGPGLITDWFTTAGPGGVYGTWEDIQKKVSDADAVEHFVVECMRTTSGGYLFWQEAFAEPR